MTERQASYNAGETEPIKHCPYCKEPRELVVNGNPDYKYVNCLSCEARGPLASNEADAIMLHNAAANALEAAKTELERVRNERDEIALDYDKEHNRANTLASEVEPLRYELSGRKLEIIAVKQRLEEADARVAELYGKCNSFESLWLAAVKQRDEARAIARKLWREKQAEKLVCPACSGERYVIVDIMGYSNGRMQKCFVCNGTGKVTK